MRVLFLENRDSFSWNLIDTLPVAREAITMASVSPAQLVGCESEHSVVARSAFPCATKQSRFLTYTRTENDSDNPPQAAGHQLALSDYDCLIIGPGPTDPIRAGIIDIVNQAARLQLPTLGVCLGYQAIGLAFGAQLVRTEPCHGKRSQITFHRNRMFAGVNGAHTVMRYHSLSLAQIVSPLRVIAQTDDGIPMAIEHESLPIAGLQFHPDSYATDQGRVIVAAFFQGMT
ncbi:MAG: aminodeoxychorismate/anthranilate synthase component II [candidate division Zixibacteria bacterium]|nr:aminodeoxychorismate/anthranilate synthase component II [candidate division Zixibacteria bacterium]